MEPPRRIRPLTAEQLSHLTEARLLAFRKKALSLENSQEDSDYANEVDRLNPTFIYFKSDPRWQAAYDLILQALARVQARV